MVEKKRSIGILGLIIVMLLSVVGCSSDSKTANDGNKTYKIGISQFVDHPALNSAREGFIEALESKGYKDGDKITIEYQNSQNDMITCQTIASNFVSQKKDMIFAVATPNAQAAYNKTKDIPVLITAVTDPVEAGLVKSMDKPETNVTGTSDATPIDKQLELLVKLLPKAKKIGVIYNTSESNSEIQINRLKELAKSLELEVKAQGVTSVNEVTQAASQLLSEVDVMYVPTDNMIASSMPILLSKTMEKGVPIVGSEKAHVEAGAVITEGIDYRNLGFQTGLMAVEIIEGKVPSELPLQTLKDTQLVINKDSAKKLGINIPDDIMKSAVVVGDGE